MEIIEIDEINQTGRVLYAGNEMSVNLILVSPKIGDHVLVHAGCAIEIIKKETAEEILSILEMIKESANGS
jgi:hydrogenase expression/formation protein HypC